MKKILIVFSLFLLLAQNSFSSIEKYQVVGKSADWLTGISEVIITTDDEHYMMEFLDDNGVDQIKYESILINTQHGEETHVLPGKYCTRPISRTCENQIDRTVKVQIMTRVFKVTNVLYGIPESWLSLKELNHEEVLFLDFGTSKRAILTLQRME